MAEIRVFAHERWASQIATLVPYGIDKKGAPTWRLTYWAPNGPLGHDVLTRKNLDRELRYWRESPQAGVILESWAGTPEWERGLKQCQFVRAWNRLSYNGRHDLCQMLDHTETLDEALELIPGVLELLKESENDQA